MSRPPSGGHGPRPTSRTSLLTFLLLAPLPLALLGYVGWQTVAAGAPEGAQAAPPRDAPVAAGKTETKTITIAWVGDTMLGRDGYLPPGNGRGLFAQVRPWLLRPDLTLANLEGVLADTGTSKCAGGGTSSACFAFRAPPSTATTLRWAGFDAVNIANNHSNDYGPAALEQSVAALADQRIATAGRPGQITTMRVRGIRVALVGLAPYPWAQNSLELQPAADLVRAARRRADIVVAMIHAGAEGSAATRTPVGREIAFGEDRGDTRRLAHTLVDAGAALVLGSGPHVVRGLESYKGRLVAYSLGNFAGWHNFASGGAVDATGVLTVKLDGHGVILSGRWRSARIAAPGIPVPQSDHASARLVRDLSVADFGRQAWPVTDTGKLAAAP